MDQTSKGVLQLADPKCIELIEIINSQYQAKVKIERVQDLLNRALQRVDDVTKACAAANNHAKDAIFDAEASLEDSRTLLRTVYHFDYDPAKGITIVPENQQEKGISPYGPVRGPDQEWKPIDLGTPLDTREREGILNAISMESQSHGLEK